MIASLRRTTLIAALSLVVMALAAPLAAAQTPQPQHLSSWRGVSHVVVPQAAGFALDPRGTPIVVESVRAHVRIHEQTARTTLQIALRSHSPRTAEAVLLLPVPADAVVGAFLFEGEAREPTARLLPRDEARRSYDEIVRRVRDPALLEFAGYNLVRSSVFPVAPHGTQTIRISYEQICPADGDRVDYALPRSESLAQRSVWKITVDIQAKQPISMVYSPTHDLKTERQAGNRIRITVDETALRDPGPFLLSYLVERQGLSASLLAYPDPKIGGGYFLLLAGLPDHAAGAKGSVKREVSLVLDRSGSMAGPKMDQVLAATRQIIEGLEDGEFFNVIDYATTISMFSPHPVVKSKDSIAAVRKYLDGLRPGGGTNIHDALIEALRQKPSAEALPLVLFLTDGLPTIGTTSEVAIRDAVAKGNPHQRRIFTFGVGNDVNAPLLDRIADSTRAVSTFVLPQEDVEIKVARIYRRLYGPILSSPRLETLDASGAVTTRRVREVMPPTLRDLFEGDQLVILGQYRGEEPLKLRVSGDYLGKPRRFELEFTLEKATTRNGFVARLWASRRIAFLADQIRQAGAAMAGGLPLAAAAPLTADPKYRELVDEILRLSTEFGILTEYTSFLATEGTDLADWERLRASCGTELSGKAIHTRSGLGAVNQSRNFNRQKGQNKLNPTNGFWDSNMNVVEFTTVQQVCDRAFFHQGGKWIDSRLIGKKDQNEVHRTVEFGSPEFNMILDRLIGQGRQGMLSLRGELLIQLDGKNVLIKNTP